MKIISLLIPVFTLLLGAFLTYYFTIKTKRKELAYKHKEDQYSKLLLKLQGFVGSTANSETQKEFFEEQYKSWLYCSDEVVKLINNMIELVKSNNIDPDIGRKAVGDIVLAMRKDLFGKTKLSYLDFRYTDVLDSNS